MTLNRVVVTGYGLTSPIGNTPEEFWNNLHDGKIVLDQSLNLIILKFLFTMLVKFTIFHLINTLFAKIKIVWTNIHFMRFMRL